MIYLLNKKSKKLRLELSTLFLIITSACNTPNYKDYNDCANFNNSSQACEIAPNHEAAYSLEGFISLNEILYNNLFINADGKVVFVNNDLESKIGKDNDLDIKIEAYMDDENKPMSKAYFYGDLFFITKEDFNKILDHNWPKSKDKHENKPRPSPFPLISGKPVELIPKNIPSWDEYKKDNNYIFSDNNAVIYWDSLSKEQKKESIEARIELRANFKKHRDLWLKAQSK